MIDEMINRKCGPHRMKTARRELNGIPTGMAKSTPSFDHDTHVKWVIHATGPVFRENALSKNKTLEEKYELLQNAYANAMKEASRLGCQDICFCLLSCGVFRGDETLEKLIGIGMNGIIETCVNDHDCTIKKIVVVAYTIEEQDALRKKFVELREKSKRNDS